MHSSASSRCGREREPGTSAAGPSAARARPHRGVDSIHLRLRSRGSGLLLQRSRACGIRRLAEAPAFELHLATGDSLLHGPLPVDGATMLFDANRLNQNIAHVYESEDAAELKEILGRGYHAVVGNPPYIAVKISAMRTPIAPDTRLATGFA